MDKEPDLAYSDKYGRRNKEYISLGCDMLPFLRGRTPIQAYSDFMRSFRDTFRDFLGVIITVSLWPMVCMLLILFSIVFLHRRSFALKEIQVGMGPAGELRYPSCPTEKLIRPGNEPELGEFQSYDKVKNRLKHSVLQFQFNYYIDQITFVLLFINWSE